MAQALLAHPDPRKMATPSSRPRMRRVLSNLWVHLRGQLQRKTRQGAL